MNITNDEKLMNGAPDGDLYELTLLQDDELLPFESNELAASEFGNCVPRYRETSIWAEKYAEVLIVRRVLVHHIDSLASVENSLISATVDMMIESTVSLRSCVIRNGLLCIRRFLRYFSTLVDSQDIGILSAKIIAALLNRTVGGPRFICDTAFETLTVAATDKHIPPLHFIKGLGPLATHKSPEVSSKALILLSKCVQSLEGSNSNSSNGSHTPGTQYRDAIKVAAIGLTARLAKGREASKEAIRLIQNRLAPAAFKDLISKVLTAAEATEVGRLDPAEKSSSHASTAAGGASSSGTHVGHHRKFVVPAAAASSAPIVVVVAPAARQNHSSGSNQSSNASNSSSRHTSSPPTASSTVSPSTGTRPRLSSDSICCGNITPKKKMLLTASQQADRDSDESDQYPVPMSTTDSHGPGLKTDSTVPLPNSHQTPIGCSPPIPTSSIISSPIATAHPHPQVTSSITSYSEKHNGSPGNTNTTNNGRPGRRVHQHKQSPLHSTDPLLQPPPPLPHQHQSPLQALQPQASLDLKFSRSCDVAASLASQDTTTNSGSKRRVLFSSSTKQATASAGSPSSQRS